MKKQKFRYNPETLSYVKVEVTWRERILRTLLVVAPAIVLGFGFQLLFSFMFQSPYEKELTRENMYLEQQLSAMREEVNLLTAVLTDIEKRDNEIYRVVVNAEPYPEQMHQLGTGGTDEYNH